MSGAMRTPNRGQPGRGAGPFNNSPAGGAVAGGNGTTSGAAASASTSSIPRPVLETHASNAAASEVGGASSVSASRQKQSKRDEAIRRRLENDLSKKKHLTSRARHSRKAPPGTVLALRPSPALQIKPSTTVAEAAQLMAAKREDCVLVTDDDDRIAGIFTAKDLAFRVVGAGLKAANVAISDIMTRDPLCASTDTSATDALDLMVRRGFRHLPVMDENQDISGILDITKCFYEAMEKLERAYASSRKLYDALEGVQSELGSSQPQQIIQYVEALRTKMSGPTLESILTGQPPTTVGVRTSVREAAQMMKENHTTAVLVQDQGAITGIFTSKDVVLRVIAPGLDPTTCSVVRVMTPHPDFAPIDMTIQAALRKMHDGHYLNLPVIDHTQEIVGMVDVLKLTYATLEQINSMSTSDGGEGPAWNKFWLSLDDGTESMLSGDGGSHHPTAQLGSRVMSPDEHHHGGRDRITDSVAPGDSASHVGASDSPISMHHPDDHLHSHGHLQPSAGDVPFPFKFRAPSGRVHRLQVTASEGMAVFVGRVAAKLGGEADVVGGAPVVEDGRLGGSGFALSYLDDDGDPVSITADGDLIEAVMLARHGGRDKVDLYVHHPDKPAGAAKEAESSLAAATATPSSTSLATPVAARERRRRVVDPEDDNEAEDDDADIHADADAEETDSTVRRRKMRSRQGSLVQQEQVIAGVPNELLLPGAIGFLAVVILGVFAISRLTSR